ncbi:MAG: HlyD family efflux transporter periplasmic adaptor subunit [Flavobacteriia bacterium]|nr:HlyD family efflux transporter periplasmic adaptor subunit [Flavobacteriia bacterium]
MDKIIEKKTWTVRRWLSVVGGLLVLSGLIYLIVAGSGGGVLKVERDRLTVGTVVKQGFEETIPITGAVQPLQSIFITATEGGTVQEIFVEDGAMVEQGDPLLRLTNANLMLDFMNRETQIIEQINNLRNTRLQIEQNKRTQSQQLIDADYQYKEAYRQFRIDSVLMRDSVISVSQFEASQNNAHYQKQRRDFTARNLAREESIQNLQLSRIDASIGLMERNLTAIRSNLENLTVRAPITGELTGFNHFLGQRKAQGENLGQVDLMSGFIVRCQVDEFYLARISQGLDAVYTLSGNEHPLRVTKVLPQVTNGQFTVEMEFLDSIPPSITRGQTLQIRLKLSNRSTALTVPRGGFYQSTGGNWVFVLDGEDRAVKRDVELGRQSTEFIEVLSGLEEGEQIILNSYTTFGDASQLEINKN